MAQSTDACITIKYNYQNSTHVEEIYAYDGLRHYDYWITNIGMTTIAVYDFKENTKTGYISSPYGKHKTVGPIPTTSMTKNYELVIDREKRKEILGYDCFFVKITDEDRKNKQHYELYVTDQFTRIPIKHKLQRIYPKLEFLPLEVIGKTYTCEATEILREVDSEQFAVKEEEYKPAAENNYGIIKKITGYSFDDFKKMLKSDW